MLDVCRQLKPTNSLKCDSQTDEQTEGQSDGWTGRCRRTEKQTDDGETFSLCQVVYFQYYVIFCNQSTNLTTPINLFCSSICLCPYVC